MLLKLLSLVLVVSTAAGCALRDRRDAPWDPPPGRALFEQLPNWDGAANRVCGGHLSEAERRRTGRSARC